MKSGWKKGLRWLFFYIGLTLVATSLIGCVSSGGVSIIDPFYSSPEGQELMNEAIDASLTQLNMDSFAGKSVLIQTPGTMVIDTPFSRTITPNIIDIHNKVKWMDYITAALERKISAAGGKSVKEEQEIQLKINENAVGLRSRIYYVPFIPFFVFDIYQHRTYWALFDATVDIKSKDGEQILKSQKIRAQSHTMEEPRIFAMSILF
jgi:hypothetical protein